MSILSDIVRGAGALLCPPRCPVCGGELPPRSGVVCPACRYTAPLTGFAARSYNPVWERLSQFVPLRQASAFLFYVDGSGWRRLIHRFKYDGAWRLARDMGRWYGAELAGSGLYADVDAVVPVPLHWRKRLGRGYNQSEYLAEGIASALDVGVEGRALRRVRNNPAQALCGERERWRNAEGLFRAVRPERLAGRHVLLVDDVLTTGATLVSCAETVVRSCPECRVSVAVLAASRRLTGPDR